MTETTQDRDSRVEQAVTTAAGCTAALESLVTLAATLCGTSQAAIHLVSSRADWVVASREGETRSCAVEDSLAAALLDEHGVVVLPDTSLEPAFRDHPGLTAGPTKVRFHASAPLVCADGLVLGRLCVHDEEPGELDEARREGLATLAVRAAGVLELQERSAELADARRQLAHAREDLRRANDHLRLFAGQVSHDLRTPLTAVLANAEMLATEPVVSESEDAQWMADGVVRAVHRMDAMIEEMLRYARDGGELSVGVTSLGELAEQALADLEPAVKEAEAQVTIDPLPTVPADAHRMYGVLRNLLENALKFRRPDVTPVVRVGAERRGGVWRVSVTDNGRGVAPDRQEAMFVLFTRADKRVEGAGIGLATAKQTVEAHGGRIGMADADGGGTTVWFELPA